MMGFSSVPLDNKCCENATTSMSWQSSRLMEEPRHTSSTFCTNCIIGDAFNGDECRDPRKVVWPPGLMPSLTRCGNVSPSRKRGQNDFGGGNKPRPHRRKQTAAGKRSRRAWRSWSFCEVPSGKTLMEKSSRDFFFEITDVVFFSGEGREE